MKLRLPNLHGTEKEQLAQLKSYLYQLVPEIICEVNNVRSVAVSADHSARSGQQTGAGNTTNVTATVDTKTIFDKLKPLIIASGEIKESYFDEISQKLEGLFVVESSFGDMLKRYESIITQTAESTLNEYSETQAIVNSGLLAQIQGLGSELVREDADVSNLKEKLLQTEILARASDAYVQQIEANIKTGKLDEDVYGMEIGQKTTVNGQETFNKYSRFTSDKISFYDQNDQEVAYISDYKQFVRNAEITSSQKTGGILSTVLSNGDVVEQWAGGKS